MGGLIPDAFSGCYCVLAVLEALYHRSRTGEGQFIEVSMTEALTGMIPEAVMQYSLTGQEQEKTGNRDGRSAPRNVFRCKGDEKWVAVSVETDEQFRALAQATGNPVWAIDPRFSPPPPHGWKTRLPWRHWCRRGPSGAGSRTWWRPCRRRAFRRRR